MKHRMIVLISLSCILLVLSLSYLIFHPSYIHISMDGMEMSTDGTALWGRTIDIKSWYFNPIFADERLMFESIRIEGTNYRVLTHHSFHVFCIDDSSYFSQCVMYDEKNRPLSCIFAWNADKSSCIVSVDERLFVGSASGDYAAALALFKDVLNLGD